MEPTAATNGPSTGTQPTSCATFEYETTRNVASKPALAGLTTRTTSKCRMPAHINNAIAEMIGVKNIEATKAPIAPPTPVSPMPTVAYSTPRKPPIAAEITAHTTAKIRGFAKSPRRVMPRKKSTGRVTRSLAVPTKLSTGLEKVNSAVAEPVDALLG